jgi:ethanolamine ammonia-lyase large subunit
MFYFLLFHMSFLEISLIPAQKCLLANVSVELCATQKGASGSLILLGYLSPTPVMADGKNEPDE